MAKLTATQEEFLKQLFGPCAGSLKKASKATIGSEDYSELLTDDLLDALKRRADKELIASVPKAIHIMTKMMDDPEGMMFMDKLHKVAADVLDRAGLSRQERPSTGTMTIGVVMLPSKSILPEPPPLILQHNEAEKLLLRQD